VNAPIVHMTVPHAAGALYSTTGDRLKWGARPVRREAHIGGIARKNGGPVQK
jgi:hypothetical protein